MSEVFNTNNVVNYFIWSLSLCLAITANAEVSSSLFYKIKEPNIVTLNTSTSDQATSITECAIKCLRQNCICYSFNKQLRRCDMGNCKASNTSTGTSDDLYITCNKKAGFKLLTSGSATACVWESTNQVDYITARDDCRAKDAYLYTAKTLDKFNLLQNIVGKYFWIGLNDMEVEGEYRWEDDNTICAATLMLQFFVAGEPNNEGDEDCVMYGYVKDKLIDGSCVTPVYYMCEQSLFNSL